MSAEFSLFINGLFLTLQLAHDRKYSFDRLCHPWNTLLSPRIYDANMTWEVEFTDEFGDWWDGLTCEEQISVNASVKLLEALGPGLQFPHSTGIKSSRHGRMRELRVQHAGEPYRVLYAFDPRRVAIILIGGNKTGDDRWYEVNIPIADQLYDLHLVTLQKEGKKDG